MLPGFYFSFGKPVDLAEVDPKDKEGCPSQHAKLREVAISGWRGCMRGDLRQIKRRLARS